MELTYRPRRLRRTPALRAMVREHSLSAADFIYPLFVHEGAEVEPIGAMPGASRWSLAALTGEVQRAYDLGVRCIVLFPKVSEGLKTEDGAECFNANGLIPRAIRQIKEAIPEMAIMTDVALDPYPAMVMTGSSARTAWSSTMRRLNCSASRPLCRLKRALI